MHPCTLSMALICPLFCTLLHSYPRPACICKVQTGTKSQRDSLPEFQALGLAIWEG